jgi:GT2 family glycosyltransferase
MNKIGIGIPTLNRADLLIPSLESYIKDFPSVDIHIVDNGGQIDILRWVSRAKSSKIHLHAQDKNLGVASSWNLLLKEIYKDCEYAMILNDDIYMGKTTYDIESILKNNPNHKIYTNPIDWCVFIMPKTTYESIGGFDEQFYPAYCEDNDYVYRLKLSGYKVFKTPLLIPKLHRASMTLEKDYTLQTAFHENKQKYIEKWGGEPDFEKFKKAYNKK